MPMQFSNVDLPGFIFRTAGAKGPGSYGIGMRSLVATPPSLLTVSFTGCVDIPSAGSNPVGVEYRVGGSGGWVQVSSMTGGPVVWEIDISPVVLNDGDEVEWRYTGGVGGILDCEKSEDIGAQYLWYQIPEAPPVVGNLALEAIVPDETTYEMLGVKTGIGGLSVARVSDIWLPDYEGVYRRFAGGEAGYKGGRVTGPVGSRVVYANDASLDPLPEVPKLWSVPAATNVVHYSSTLDSFSMGGLVFDTTTEESALEGQQARLIRETARDDVHMLNTPNLPLVAVGEWYCVSVIAKASGRDFLRLYGSKVTFNDAGAYFSLIDGTIGTNTAFDARITPLVDDWYLCQVKLECTDTGVQRIYIGFAEADDSDSYPGNLNSKMLFSNVNCEAAVWTEPIVTEGAALTRDKDAYSLDLANWDDTEGTFYCEVTTTGTSDILDHFLSYSGNMTLYDGTNSHSMAAALGDRKVGFVWGSGTMRLNVDGVWHSEGPYDGTMLQGAFDLFRDALVVGGIRGIKRWDSKDESIIDQEMAG